MSFTNAAKTAVLDQVFKGTALPWDANTTLYLALFTADPGAAGSIASEATYTGYARVPLTRASDITVSGSSMSNTNLEQFDPCTGGSNTITYAAIVTDASGATTMISRAALTSSILVSDGVVPQFAAASITFTMT